MMQWRWYYEGRRVFESDGFIPDKGMIESIFLADQDIFMVDVDSADDAMHVLLNYKEMTMKNLKKSTYVSAV